MYRKGTKRFGRKAIKPHIAYDYHIANCSYTIHLLGVNREARDEALAANPQFLQINNGPKVYFNARNNLIHFDYQGLHILQNCVDHRQHPERILKGFDNIINVSVTTASTIVLSKLRGIPIPTINVPLPAYSPLSGVTYVNINHHAVNMHNLLMPYRIFVRAEYKRLRDLTNHPGQIAIINWKLNVFELIRVANDPDAYYGAIAWSALPGKGKGVRAPEQ